MKIKTFFFIFFLASFSGQVFASDINCKTFLKDYAKKVSNIHYAIDDLDKKELTKFLKYLTKTTNSQMECSALNFDDNKKELFHIIFAKKMSLRSYIKAYLDTPKAFIGDHIQEDYLPLRDAANKLSELYQ